MSDDFDIEDVLRASLAEHAREAPPADPLAERIIAEADHPRQVHDLRGPRRWRGWMLPAVAAASVAAVVATIVGLAQLKHSGKPAADRTPLQSGRPSSSSATSTESVQVYSGQPTDTQTTTLGQPGGSVPHQFKVTDLTFVSEQHGWALGRGGCLDGSPGTCPAILRTTDGGADWTSTPIPAVDIEPACGSAPCVSNLRFATDQVGYAYGPGALYMTVDGGQTWGDRQGDTSSLEVENGTALRVTGDRLLTAKVGSTSWKSAALPPKATVVAPVVRALHNAYVPAANRDSLYASTDDGAHWTQQPAPCSSGGAIDTMSAGADGSLVVMCSTAADQPELYVSDKGGANFAQVAGLTDANLGQPCAAADASTLFCTSPGRLERNTDNGGAWTVVATDKTDGTAGFLGFQNSSTGRWVTGDGSTIYTTTDSGQTWKPYHFK